MMTGVLFYKLMNFLTDSSEFNSGNQFSIDKNIESIFEDSFSPINTMYRNRIPLSRRTPINLNLKTIKNDGVYNHVDLKELKGKEKK